jgi:hypothetical protein
MVDVSPSRLLLSVEDDGIGHGGVDAQLIEKGRQLSAMLSNESLQFAGSVQFATMQQSATGLSILSPSFRSRRF